MAHSVLRAEGDSIREIKKPLESSCWALILFRSTYIPWPKAGCRANKGVGTRFYFQVASSTAGSMHKLELSLHSLQRGAFKAQCHQAAGQEGTWGGKAEKSVCHAFRRWALVSTSSLPSSPLIPWISLTGLRHTSKAQRHTVETAPKTELCFTSSAHDKYSPSCSLKKQRFPPNYIVPSHNV